MASYLIKDGSLQTKGDKTAMTVTFKATDGRSVTQYYEVDSTDPAEVEKVLADAALAYDAMAPEVQPTPDIQTGTTVNVEVTPEA